ncbi:MAG: D-aminoacylase [Candidatus Sungiibacteriota bacterium]|uniref:D-aminoacylase n=1 Tax=Candidatus Sungiibacteriota bacterium TaxID=2750080 RepID=A0A7T5RJJ6_9BACT|nr:MAG: D-aminoacylase [Candidatus Sungbacteria bacterium]
MAYDILIKSGTIIDGSGNMPLVTDLAINGDTIEEMGSLGGVNATTIIDASGKYVTPGFIDITNHSDTRLTLFKYPLLESLVMQGITTIIGGNCGTSLAPLGTPAAVDAIKKWADLSEVSVDWATMDEFLSTVNKLHPGINFGTLIGYGTLRRGVLGDEMRLLNLEEREKLKQHLLREGIKEGAFGLSLGLAYGHERLSTTEEIVDIARIVAQENGLIKIHLRSEGKEILASVNEAIRIGREAGVSVQISHLKAIGKKSWPFLPKTLELIEKARATGVDINFDVSPYPTTGSPLYLLLPPWTRDGGFTKLFERIKDPIIKRRIIEELKTHTLHYDKILITSARTKTAVGHTLAELAEEGGTSTEDTLLNILLANDGRVGIVGRTVSQRNTELEVRDKSSFIASDGVGYKQEEYKSGNLIHPRSFGAFPHFWHRFVKELTVLSPEEAIQKITYGPAKKMGIKQRGLIKSGNFADIVVFDPKLLKDRASYRNPYRYPAGIEWVIINGEVAVEEGRFMDARAGRVLRKT